ncbi:MAG: response regulator transcription factor [Chlorobiaceae bacterium]|jgi:DNA-binding response OmpR family regulator|nr:response regulator transcription factor [Chlorobiaceae bacterium]
MNILVIEDDSAVRNFVMTIIKEENHTVPEAENGINGLKVSLLLVIFYFFVNFCARIENA